MNTIELVTDVVRRQNIGMLRRPMQMKCSEWTAVDLASTALLREDWVSIISDEQEQAKSSLHSAFNEYDPRDNFKSS